MFESSSDEEGANQAAGNAASSSGSEEESSEDDVDFTFPTDDATELMQFLHRDVNNLSNMEDH